MDAARGPGIDTPAGYTRLEWIGAGGEGHVYRAWDERAGRPVVLKLFHRFAAGRAEESAFAAYCAGTVGLGRHPSIVPVRSGGITATGRPWLALDLVEGRTLADVLDGADRPAPAQALDLAIILAGALAWAHSMRPPMAHGRLRPDYILIDETGVPLLTDFAAPLVTAPVSPRADVVALGTLVFHTVTGKPWPGDPGADQVVAAWPGLTRLLDEVLAPIPEVATMAEFGDRLRAVRRSAGATRPLPSGSVPVSAPPGGAAAPPGPASPGPRGVASPAPPGAAAAPPGAASAEERHGRTRRLLARLPIRSRWGRSDG